MPRAAKKAKAAIASVKIPKAVPTDPNSTSPQTPKTPKTPADEGIEFFESVTAKGDQPIRVYELRLDPDGGPNKDRAVEYPSPSHAMPNDIRLCLPTRMA